MTAQRTAGTLSQPAFRNSLQVSASPTPSANNAAPSYSGLCACSADAATRRAATVDFEETARLASIDTKLRPEEDS